LKNAIFRSASPFHSVRPQLQQTQMATMRATISHRKNRIQTSVPREAVATALVGPDLV
jgi:hypothetical protein